MALPARNPLPKGFMKEGKFDWPIREYACIGYTMRGVLHECGIKLESTTGNLQRCRACHKEHMKEYHRLYKQRKRAKG